MAANRPRHPGFGHRNTWVLPHAKQTAYRKWETGEVAEFRGPLGATGAENRPGWATRDRSRHRDRPELAPGRWQRKVPRRLHTHHRHGKTPHSLCNPEARRPSGSDDPT